MKALVIGSLMFFPLNMRNVFVKGRQKYMAGTKSGVLFPDEIYTLEEIKEKHPTIKEVDELCQ